MQYSTLNLEDRQVLNTVRRMVDHLRTHPSRADMIRADLNAYVSEHARGSDNRPRGDLLTVLFWTYPQFIDVRPVADALGVMPSVLRTALGLDGVR